MRTHMRMHVRSVRTHERTHEILCVRTCVCTACVRMRVHAYARAYARAYALRTCVSCVRIRVILKSPECTTLSGDFSIRTLKKNSFCHQNPRYAHKSHIIKNPQNALKIRKATLLTQNYKTQLSYRFILCSCFHVDTSPHNFTSDLLITPPPPPIIAKFNAFIVFIRK